MMEKMIALQQKRRSKKGGFTLVELIVVLVILAILAALLIPALTGYINRAKEKNVIAETRQCVMAAQTLYDEAYADADKNGNVTAPSNSEIQKLAEVKGNVLETDGHKILFTNGRITHLEYSNNGITCTYNGSTYDVPKN